MSTMYEVGVIPEFNVGDRLAKARSLTGLNSTDFAKRIGVSQKTINNAESGKHTVRKIVMNAWAMGTGVPVEWLETGIAPTENGGGDTSGADDETRTRNILLGSAKVLHPAFGASRLDSAA